MTKLKNIKPTYFKIISVLTALILWQIIAACVGNEMLLASPVSVLKRLTSIWKEEGFFTTVLFSFLRISAGFLSALIVGFFLGIISGRARTVEMLLWPYVTAVKTVPVASFIILCLIWFDFNTLTVFISFLIAFPVVYTNVLRGVKDTDVKMKELAAVYKIPKKKQFIYILLPSVKPFLISSASVSAGMAWKAGVAAEVIGIADGSIGEMLYQAKVYFQNADLLCWTIVIILLSVLTEKIVVMLLRMIFKGVEKL